jgi:uncharacterized protein (DUF433 family)
LGNDNPNMTIGFCNRCSFANLSKHRPRLPPGHRRVSLAACWKRIQRDPGICDGQPVVKGTRVLVRTILGYLAHGETVDAILREFPSLTEEDVRAVIAFTAASASEDLPAPSPIPPVAEVV